MILHALTQYYERKSTAEKGALPPYGFERKEILAVIEIGRQGELIQILRKDKDSKSSEYTVPQSVKRAANIAANLLWDNAEYALGIDIKGKPKRVLKKHKDFIERIKSLDEPAKSDEGTKALLCFFERDYIAALKEDQHWEFLQFNPNVSFQLQSDNFLICERESIRDTIKNKNEKSSNTHSICLVTGNPAEPKRLHPAIKGVWGAQPSGANIVSFNLNSFSSYGKKQGLNAPVGEKVTFEYTTALNHLLRKGSEQRFQVGDASTVCWSAEKNAEKNDFENNFATIFKATPSTIKDDPDKYTGAVKAVFNSIHRGEDTDDTRPTHFYVLGLAPNASRIAIRFWLIGTVREFSQRIKKHFDDLEIRRGANDQEYLPLFLLLINIAVQGKSENIPPNLAGETMRAILAGQPYPYTLFVAAIRRCKAKQHVNYPRAAIIKAYLNRRSDNDMEVLKVALDKENVDPAYRLGRLFAALEKIQEEANPGINATIKDRYYGAASSNPISVFPTLLKLKNHHMAKLGNSGRKVNFEKLLGEIMTDIPPSLPTALPLQGQGKFAVGYYHQRQDFFTKRNTNPSGEEV